VLPDLGSVSRRGRQATRAAVPPLLAVPSRRTILAAPPQCLVAVAAPAALRPTACCCPDTEVSHSWRFMFMCVPTPLHPVHKRSPACASFPPQSQSNPLWWTTGNAQGAIGTYQCCPADHVGTDRQNRAYCCPSAGANQRVDSVTLACCPAANFDTASGTCCQSALASVSTCASTCASNNWGSSGTCSAGEQNDRTEILCCSTSTTTSKRGCPAGLWSTSTCVATCTNGCCPAAQVAYSDYPRGYPSTVCCPASGGPFQVTRTENCCPISTLGQSMSVQHDWVVRY